MLKSDLMGKLSLRRRPVRDDLLMVETLIDLGRYLGMPVRAGAHLAKGSWVFTEDGEIAVSHDLWESLGLLTFDFELLTEAIEDASSASHRPLPLAAE